MKVVDNIHGATWSWMKTQTSLKHHQQLPFGCTLGVLLSPIKLFKTLAFSALGAHWCMKALVLASPQDLPKANQNWRNIGDICANLASHKLLNCALVEPSHICCRIQAVKFNPCHQIYDEVAAGFKPNYMIEQFSSSLLLLLLLLSLLSWASSAKSLYLKPQQYRTRTEKLVQCIKSSK